MFQGLLVRYRNWKQLRMEAADKLYNEGYAIGYAQAEAHFKAELEKERDEKKKDHDRYEKKIKEEQERADRAISRLNLREEQLNTREEKLDKWERYLISAIAQCQASRVHFDGFVKLVRNVVAVGSGAYDQVDTVLKQLEKAKEGIKQAS